MAVEKIASLCDISGKSPLQDNIAEAVQHYLEYLGNHNPTNLYELMLQTVELPLLKVVMEHTKNNQTRAASVLGISRGTLRKKLELYNILPAE